MQTLTFYSYKGGVGRTLMVANMARYLASFGKRVLAVDFDLEAPGLHYKLGLENPERGLVDYLHELFLVGEVPDSLGPYVVTIEPENAAGGSLHLLPAGAAPSPVYWRQLAKLDWHALFYSEEAPGVPLFLELQERISREIAPDFLLIDSRTGITEVVGATTTLLADRVICLLLNNRENLDGAREVLRSLRRAPRLPGQAQLEIWPVLSRIPEVGGELEAGLVREVREFLCAEADDLISTLTFPELFVLHTDPDLQLREALSVGGGKGVAESPLLRDYLALFGRLVPPEDLVGPTIRAIAERWETDRASAEKDFAKLAELAVHPELEALFKAEIARLGEEKARLVAEWLQEKAAGTAEETRSLLHVLGFPTPSKDLIQTTTQYLEHLATSLRYVSFRGLGASDQVRPWSLPLLDLYVPARVYRGIPWEKTWMRDGAKVLDSRPVLGLLRAHDGLILLGDPGTGKTTFLKYLALALATGQGEALGLDSRLPVLLPLVAYANALARREISLEDFLSWYYAKLGFPLGDLLEEALKRGRALLLLDGMDEVRELDRRQLMMERVLEFYQEHRPAGNKLVLTSRSVGYQDMRLGGEGLVEATLLEFTEEDIESLVEKWTVALANQVPRRRLAPALLDAAHEREGLLAAIQDNPGVLELAANPLLLIILLLMLRKGVEIPARRVEYYRICVDSLLKHWNLARSLDDHSGGGLDLRETLKILAPLALWIHQVTPGSGLIKEGELLLQLERIYRERGEEEPEKTARQFLQDVQGHSSLLVDYEGGHCGIIYLSLQEYLAAMALARQVQTGVGEVARSLAEHAGEPAWREVILLTIGYLGVIEQLVDATSHVVESLLQVKEPPGVGVILAGEALLDLGVDGVTPNCRTQTIKALISTVQDETLPASVRAEAVRPLVRLGVGFPGGLWF